MLATQPGGELLFWEMLMKHSFNYRSRGGFVFASGKCCVASLDGMQLGDDGLELMAGDLVFEDIQSLEDRLVQPPPQLSLAPLYKR
ncbi:hypothetical protein [Nocardia alni]|uniref:hypothetical protein n=1 Tax=Nocardia alni TaxID=2815723 RepID=UPI001C218561|nr:hypothetical protein [Nocardia alni]